MQKLDYRILNPIKDLLGRRGILSTGSEEFIAAVLHYPSDYGFSTVVANPIVRNGRGTEFRLDIYGNKPEMLEQQFFERGFDPKRTVYLGDNADEEPAFQYVLDRGGRIVIPFYATDAFKQHAATKYRAEVPENEHDFRRFLQSLGV
jgi:hypothetical protein